MEGNRTPVLFTFRTFPRDLLESFLPDLEVYILGRLKDDLKLLQSRYPDETTPFIGFALSSSTRQEGVAINKFNNGRINPNGPSRIDLPTIEIEDIAITQEATWSFCNYAAYTLAQRHKVHFIHITRKDFPKVAAVIKGQIS